MSQDTKGWETVRAESLHGNVPERRTGGVVVGISRTSLVSVFPSPDSSVLSAIL